MRQPLLLMFVTAAFISGCGSSPTDQATPDNTGRDSVQATTVDGQHITPPSSQSPANPSPRTLNSRDKPQQTARNPRGGYTPDRTARPPLPSTEAVHATMYTLWRHTDDSDDPELQARLLETRVQCQYDESSIHHVWCYITRTGVSRWLLLTPGAHDVGWIITDVRMTQ